ncbi:B-cell receptor CD22-like isoform X2 [Vanacampus margaritifer]
MLGDQYDCNRRYENWCSGRMKNHTLISFLLASLFTASQCLDIPFEVRTQSTSIKEGSCIELTLTSNRELPGLPVNWFWMKDSHWSASQNKFIGTVILTSDTNLWPVHPNFVDRVKSQGSPPTQWHAGTSLMSLMCSITKRDNGNYTFIYQFTEGSPWAEASAVVNVEDNPCLVEFSQPTSTADQVVKLLYCYYKTHTCPVNMQLLDRNLPIQLPRVNGGKMIIAKILNNWQNDGKKIVCQAEGNTDEYLRKYIPLDIPHSPKVVNASFLEGVTFYREGDRMTLDCTAHGNPAPTFEWFKYDESLVKAARWFVPSVSLKHNGKYKCVATNKKGSHESTLEVDVKYPPTVRIRANDTTVSRGENLILSCLVRRGNPWPNTFTWYKDDKPISTQNDHQYIVLSPVPPKYKGRYKCVAYNTAYGDMKGTSSQLFIDVEYRPQKVSLSIMGSASTEVKAGASVKLQCTTDANPEPDEYVWTLFSHDGPFLKSLPDNTELLLLRELQPSDRFCYVCSAVNAVGSSRVSNFLCVNVLHGPTNLVLSMPDKVPEGEMVSVRCSAESFPLSNLTLTRTSRDQSSFESAATILGKTAQNNVLSYSFTATGTDDGVYTCKATNTEGIGSSQNTLEVTYAPRNVTVKANPSLVVTKNKTLTLQCVGDSNPPIKSVIWWKADSVYQNEADRQALIMTNITTDHTGIYGCTATNELGSARSPPVEVKVHGELPDPLLSMVTKVTEGELVSMLCSVESDLLSILTFTRVSSKSSSEWPGASSHGNAVQNNRLSHTLKATSADSGVYICEADYGFGKRSAQKTLQVMYLNKLLNVVMTTDTDWILKFIIPPVFVFFIVALILIYIWRAKRRSKQALINFETSELNTDKIASYVMFNLSSAGRCAQDPSATNTIQKEPPKEKPLLDPSLQAEHGQRKYAIPKEKQSKETRSKDTSEDAIVYMSYALVHLQPEWRASNDDSEEDIYMGFSV